MISYIDSNLFESPAKVLVNTVNTQGVMGKGIALRFKRIYPRMFKRYQELCEHGDLQIGRLHLYKTSHKWILNFPTKERWRCPSRTEYIEAGLKKFTASHAEMGITSISFPLLGCGNGELDFETQVKPLMEKYLGKLSILTLIHVGWNHIVPPERLDANITEWLRSEPSALPFDEVWQDIIEVLDHKCEFRTRVMQNSFSVHAEAEPPELVVVPSSGRTIRIVSEELISFWQQLRDYGLTHGSIAPEHRYLSYLMPVFEQLRYVHPVKISKSTASLRKNPTGALQVIPLPVCSPSSNRDLFGNTTDAIQTGL